MKLDCDYSFVRETAARDGWFAYYGDGTSNTIGALPVVLWCVVDVVRYTDGRPDEPVVVQMIRPFVLTRAGKVIDAHDFGMPFLCILGPDVDHVVTLRRVLQQMYPDKNWDRATPSTTMN